MSFSGMILYIPYKIIPFLNKYIPKMLSNSVTFAVQLCRCTADMTIRQPYKHDFDQYIQSLSEHAGPYD